jgi:murein DD-endopeptidase MepM/ murein hydrolase activator NlpD
VVRHADGTTALYGHLTHEGALVGVGDAVRQGDVLALSGNTGNTANKPHLHFSVATRDPVAGGTDGCPTLPVNFRNSVANPSGPQVGQSYPALAPCSAAPHAMPVRGAKAAPTQYNGDRIPLGSFGWRSQS